MGKTKYISDVHKMKELDSNEKQVFSKVSEQFKFRTNSYYNALIDWTDPNDPLRRVVIPDADELINWGTLDASDEIRYQPVEGLEHKYPNTALLLCNEVCGAYCRFCFRKRLFKDENDEVKKDVFAGIAYIQKHKGIDNVLLTGGDPLMLSNRRIMDILDRLKTIQHVKVIRFGTKMLGFDPLKISENKVLLDYLSDYSLHKKVYFMLHFNHPREMTSEALHAIQAIQTCGVITVNQTPIIRGVNDNVETMTQLFSDLSFAGVLPYYVFSCRPTAGNFTYAVPVEEAYAIFIKARSRNSGLAKTARFVMSYTDGKIEVIAKTGNKIYFKKHNWANSSENEELLVFPSNSKAYWFDDYLPKTEVS